MYIKKLYPEAIVIVVLSYFIAIVYYFNTIANLFLCMKHTTEKSNLSDICAADQSARYYTFFKEGLMEHLTKVNGRRDQLGETHAHSVAQGRHPRHFRVMTE